MKTPAQILEDVREADCPPGGRARAEHVISEAMSAAEAKGRREGLEEAIHVADGEAQYSARQRDEQDHGSQQWYGEAGRTAGARSIAGKLRALIDDAAKCEHGERICAECNPYDALGPDGDAAKETT